MTEVTAHEAGLGIGELARLAGVPVRTVRFYCDEGILESRRSAGGHRRFDPAAVDRLRLVRRLRTLGLGLPAITGVLAGRLSVGEAVAAERAAVDAELTSLAWRSASLRAIEEAGPAERAARLELLAAVAGGRAAYDVLVAFWRRTFGSPLPDAMLSMFLSVAVPEPPAEPTPDQVVAYAEMVTLVADRSLVRRYVTRARADRDTVRDESALLAGVGAACELARPLLLAGRRPAPGHALDRFVAAHAEVRGAEDTPAYRSELLAATAVDRDPRVRRYWGLLGRVTGEPVTVGAMHGWLIDALDRSVTDRR
ncbi:MerR family transcriptional regulator [Streptomyces sp. AcH 505]|uniref:MerR family transcriptional regulator n=1 Tax=Streptomyces sp. AcH 505 TaxID=352211 RepID=UPI000591EEF4|nr:MerR family transcriptional regulator [Streptomyces sp. AcH 505]